MSKTNGATITLIRGRNYSVIHPTNRRMGAMTFSRGEGIFVEDEDLITACEALFETIVDGDEEEIQKPIFSVERGGRARGAIPADVKAAKTRAVPARGRTTRKL
jgi:hypothetical protein